MRSLVLFILLFAGCSFAVTSQDAALPPAPDLASVTSPDDGGPPRDFGLGDLVINEVFPHGTSAMTPDWVELRNINVVTIDVSGWQLGDEKSKATLPSGTLLPAGGFLVAYCDDQADGGIAGGIHLPFKLSGKGDSIHLMRADDSVADEVSWTMNTIPSPMSYGRLPDGVGPFMPLTPSPGALNQ